jgi:hypothetical protein
VHAVMSLHHSAGREQNRTQSILLIPVSHCVASEQTQPPWLEPFSHGLRCWVWLLVRRGARSIKQRSRRLALFIHRRMGSGRVMMLWARKVRLKSRTHAQLARRTPLHSPLTHSLRASFLTSLSRSRFHVCAQRTHAHSCKHTHTRTHIASLATNIRSTSPNPLHNHAMHAHHRTFAIAIRNKGQLVCHCWGGCCRPLSYRRRQQHRRSNRVVRHNPPEGHCPSIIHVCHIAISFSVLTQHTYVVLASPCLAALAVQGRGARAQGLRQTASRSRCCVEEGCSWPHSAAAAASGVSRKQ